MTILKAYVEEPDEWEEVSEDKCIELTEGRGYWKPGTVLDMLKDGQIVRTPFATYKAG